MVGSIIQIFNRAPFALKATKDGRDYPIPVGLSHITSDILPYAKNQNPVPGTENPETLEFESLVSYVHPDPKKQRDPLDPIPADVLAAMPVERIDRGLLQPDRQNATALHPMFPKGRVGIDSPTAGMRDPGKHAFGGDD